MLMNILVHKQWCTFLQVKLSSQRVCVHFRALIPSCQCPLLVRLYELALQPAACEQVPSLQTLSSLWYSHFFFLTPVNLMGERVCDSRNESLLELGWPQAGAVSRFERPCSDPQLRAEMKKTDA